METLQWTCLLGLLSIQAAPCQSENPVVSQNPGAISLTKVNSMAEIRCNSSLSSLLGLTLLRRYSRDRQVVYLSVPNMKLTAGWSYEHRVSVTGKCCDFTIHLSQLTVDDTDGYYCRWTRFDARTKEMMTLQSEETIIIVRERDPRDDCSHNITVKSILFILGLSLLVIVMSIIIGTVVWYCTRINVYGPAKVHRHRQWLCPLHSDRQRNGST
ncbi:hypothetical protein GN956_G8312 [Arapaima gigas]